MSQFSDIYLTFSQCDIFKKKKDHKSTLFLLDSVLFFSEFYVRWVDDNHALGIFSIASHAGQALRENKEQVHTDAGQVVKLRTLNQAGRLTQLKAQRLIGKYKFEKLQKTEKIRIRHDLNFS